MRTICLIVSLFIGGLLLPNHSFALVSSNGMGGGAWSAAPSWDTGVPVCGDSILIQSGDIITLASQQDYSACGGPMVLTINGTLNFPGNGTKLKLPAGSTVIVNIGGLISAVGGDNSNKIAIGTEWVWEKADGDVPGFACFGACGLLPVNFISVEAILNERSVCIRWITLTESNNEYFTVERSTDGFNFKEIIEVKGAGTSNSIINYEAKDLEPLKGVSYYRLRQTDYDGKYAYSQIVSIEVSFLNLSTVLMFPNPIRRSDEIQIVVGNIFAGQRVRVELRRVGGNFEFLQDFSAIQDGDATFTLYTKGRLRPGLYLVSIITESELETRKLLVR